MKTKLSVFYGVKGFVHNGDGVLNLRYLKGASRKIFSVMYYQEGLLFLDRKYSKMKTAFEKDADLEIIRKQKKFLYAAVAQW